MSGMGVYVELFENQTPHISTNEAGLRPGDEPETLLSPFVSYEATVFSAQEAFMHNCSFSAGKAEGQLLLI